ncbi:glycine, alanine and asparagine-rich protein-like [Anopheles bellator]|uniref:glycine, alanine and asparagine-rich protein-like n=1 Tax=Anopheles bellator TaxID=139047 RepID=UPI0026487578|nr:glycine, alanine and asparagine-rich protein-like [Anopheles bellator]
MPYSFHHRLPCSSPSSVQPMDLNTHSAVSAAAAAAAASAAVYSQSISMTDLSQMTPPSAVAAATTAAGLPTVIPRHLPIITSAIASNPTVISDGSGSSVSASGGSVADSGGNGSGGRTPNGSVATNIDLETTGSIGGSIGNRGESNSSGISENNVEPGSQQHLQVSQQQPHPQGGQYMTRLE